MIFRSYVTLPEAISSSTGDTSASAQSLGQWVCYHGLLERHVSSEPSPFHDHFGGRFMASGCTLKGKERKGERKGKERRGERNADKERNTNKKKKERRGRQGKEAGRRRKPMKEGGRREAQNNQMKEDSNVCNSLLRFRNFL